MFVIPTSAQTVYQERDRYETQRQDGYHRQGRNRRWRNNRHNLYVVNEQRYIQVRRRVYREVYQSTYTRRGMLVHRVLVSRERVQRYDHYNNNDYRREGLRFNVFLRF